MATNMTDSTTKFMRKGELTRAAILDMALDLAARDGLEGLTLRVGDIFFLPNGFRIWLEKQLAGTAWRLVGSRSRGTGASSSSRRRACRATSWASR